MSNNKRPAWVWVIFIWFTLAGLLAIYKFYTVASGLAVMLEGVERPTGAFYYIKAFGFQFLAMAAAILLFMRNHASKWLFAIFLAGAAASILYTLIFGSIPSQNITLVIVIIFGTFLIYSLITWYAFRLTKSGYYIDKNT